MAFDNSSNDGENQLFAMKKRISFWSGVAITVSAIVGSGIFVTPTGILRAVNGSVGVSLMIWVICGFIAMSSCLCYCELGTSLKTSGEDFLNFKLVYGPALAFVYVWSCVTIRPLGGAATYLIFSRYITAPFFQGCDPPEQLLKITAISLLLFLHYINYASVKTSVMFEVIVTAAKYLALALIAIVGIGHLISGNPIGRENFEKAFDSEKLRGLSVSDVSLAFYQGLFTYSGFQALTFVSEEMKNPQKNLHKASILALTSVMFIYLLVNVAYFSVLTSEEITSSKAVAELFGSKALGSMAWLIPLFVCISTFGHLNGVVLLAPRNLFAGSRSGLAPQIFGMIHIRHHSPVSSLMMSATLTITYILVGEFYTLTSAFSFLQWSCQGLSAASVLVLRKKFPNLPRPYKVPLICPIFTCLVSVYFIITPFIKNPNPIYFVAIAFYLLAAVAYYIFIVRTLYLPGINRITLILQKLMQVAETDWDEPSPNKDTY